MSFSKLDPNLQSVESGSKNNVPFLIDIFSLCCRETIAVLVGSEDLAGQYIEETGNTYMSRGHLAPKADFMYTSWQVINACYVLRTAKET